MYEIFCQVTPQKQTFSAVEKGISVTIENVNVHIFERILQYCKRDEVDVYF